MSRYSPFPPRPLDPALGRGEGVGTPLLAEQGHRVLGVPGEPGVGTVVQGLLESSNADPHAEYLRVIQAQRAYELNVRALKTMDEMLQAATNLRRS